MKKRVIATIFLALILFQGGAFSQWTHSFDCNKPLNKVFTLDLNHAYAVGPNGVFFRTSNGGFSWEQVQTNCTKELYDVQFIDQITGFICGASGTLLKSIDGGATWNSCTTNTTLHLKSLCFINSNTGWISGSSSSDIFQLSADSGIVLKTTDGGTSIFPLLTGNYGIQKVVTFNPDTCLAICNGFSSGSFIIRTYNAGTTWQTIHVASCNSLTSCAAFPSGLAYASCNNSFFYKTTNYGNTWDSTLLSGGQVPLDISFPAPLIGYTAGFDPMAGQGSVYNTADGGESWTLQLFDHYFCSVSFCNDTIGFVITGDGTIFKKSLNYGNKAGSKTNLISVTIYPNPVTTCLYIKINNSSIHQPCFPYVIEVYSDNGYKIMERIVNEQNIEMTDLQFLTPGQYNIVIKDNCKKLYSGKFIKLD